MEENKEKDMRNAYNQEEAELIRKLVQLRQEQKVELEYLLWTYVVKLFSPVTSKL